MQDGLEDHLITSTGADQLEGGFDAIVQAVACQSVGYATLVLH